MHLSGGGLAWHVLVLDLIPSTASNTSEQEVILIMTFSYMHLQFFGAMPLILILGRPRKVDL